MWLPRSGSASAAAAVGAQAGDGPVASPGSVAAARRAVAATAARTPTVLPATAHQPAAAARRHRLLRVQGRRLPAAGDPLDEARTSARRQGQVGSDGHWSRR